MNDNTKAYMQQTQIHLKVLELYRDLGQQLVPLVDEKELVPGAKASLHAYLNLIIEDIALSKRKLALLEKNPNFPFEAQTPSPQAQMKLTQSQILLYDKYKSLGMDEDEAINRSLDPYSTIFRKFEDLAVIYDHHAS